MKNRNNENRNLRLYGIKFSIIFGMASVFVLILSWFNTSGAFSKNMPLIVEEKTTLDSTLPQVNITLPADSGPIDTGVYVQKNDFILITSTGTIFNGEWNPTADGGSNPPNPAYGETILPNLATTSLVGSVGDFSTGTLLDDGSDINPQGISGTEVGYPGLYGPGYLGSYFETIATSDGNIFIAINDTPLDDNTGNFEVSITISRECNLPFFSQRDDEWITHTLRTADNKCSEYCNTIGHCGCTLTSASMVFNNYGAETNPKTLSDCMDTSACPYDWDKGARDCSNGKAKWSSQNKIGWNDGNPNESWERLETEINENHRPVILGMHKIENNIIQTHWVVVHTGQGKDSEYYIMHDPWYKCGANIPLATRYYDWNFDWMSIYEGKNPCSAFNVENPPCVAEGANPQPILTETLATENNSKSIFPDYDLASNSIISGSIVVFTRTMLTMTVEITATSSVGTITDMMVWSDTLENKNWQPFTNYVWLPVSEYVYIKFRDNVGNVTETYSDTINPIGPPRELYETLLPLLIKFP